MRQEWAGCSLRARCKAKWGADGLAGFRFAKLDATGQRLPNDAATWACVQDLVTNLTWEVKTSDGGLHDASKIVSQAFTPNGTTYAEEFAESVNQETFCGFADWRVPSKDEGDTLMAFGGPTQIQTASEIFFPEYGLRTWTSTCARQSLDGSCGLTSIGADRLVADWIYEFNPVRVVRGQPLITQDRYELNQAEVFDKRTGITWARCVVGQRWNGNTCTGQPSRLTVRDALYYARSEARRTGVAWRLPNIKELMSISVHPYREGRASINLDVFPNTPLGNTWSNTSTVTLFWALDFTYGSQSVDISPIEQAYVRLTY